MRAVVRMAVVAAICLFICRTASAQGSGVFSLTGGYSSLRDDEIDERLHGWLVSGTGRLTSRLGITAEIGGNNKALPVLGTTLKYRDLSIMSGPRVPLHRFEKVTPFGQVLVGGVRATVGILDQSRSRTDFALQPGVGVDVWISANVGITAGADYRRITAADAAATHWRFHVGAVVGGNGH